MAKDIIDEVKEDIKNEKEAFITTKVTKIFTVTAIVMVISVAIYSWKNRTVKELQSHMSGWLNSAFLAIDANQPDEAIKYFDKVIAYPHQEIAAFAYLNKAALLYKQQKQVEAEKTLQEMIKVGHFDKSVMELAELQYFAYKFSAGELDSNDENKVLDRLSQKDQPWHISALLLKALYEFKKGKVEEAKQDLKKVLSDPKASKASLDIATNIYTVISR